MLRSGDANRCVSGTSNLQVGRGRVSRPEAEQRLKRDHGLSPTIVPKDELVQVDLQLRLTDSMVRADQPLLQVPIARSASGTTEGAPLRRALGEGCVRRTWVTAAACKS